MVASKVLLLGQIEHAHEEWNALSSLAEIIEPNASNRTEFLEECRSGKFEGVLVAYRTFNSLEVTGRLDDEVLQCLPASLRFICHCGAGYDQVDVQACTSHGIKVSNVPSVTNDATADANMFLILGALRGLNSSMLAIREGKWRGHPAPPLGHDPRGKTLGIVGMGSIGRNLKDKATAFGMEIIYHNRNPLDEDMERGARYVSFDELLRTSDVISLNLPLNDGTRHLISDNEFQQMKRGVVIVNTARGAIIHEDALVRALDSGQVWSCGLDVYEEEPSVHPGLTANPHVMLLPHMGTYTVETMTAMERCAIDNVRAVLEQGRLCHIVPEQAHLP